ncbi:hypothetical protein Rin_00015150 [Candidatus Regiella insecticola 5.15]|uniref:Uncharacterized protein n=1 Tax=Candidatus Regiella insecticola 5.15 TaxID=1005043 RepID=G2H0D6_9ENTR|nr:hypothetical protein Rin_00015150 [Candidatus Regiella insecticola 5.15]
MFSNLIQRSKFVLHISIQLSAQAVYHLLMLISAITYEQTTMNINFNTYRSLRRPDKGYNDRIRFLVMHYTPEDSGKITKVARSL